MNADRNLELVKEILCVSNALQSSRSLTLVNCWLSSLYDSIPVDPPHRRAAFHIAPNGAHDFGQGNRKGDVPSWECSPVWELTPVVFCLVGLVCVGHRGAGPHGAQPARPCSVWERSKEGLQPL